MISVTTSLGNLLSSSNTFFSADLYTFYLINGTVVRYTSANSSLTFDGVTWLGNDVAFDRGKISIKVGVEVDSLQIKCYPAPSNVIGANPFLQLAVNGGLDGCYVQLDRAFSPGPGQPLTGIVPLLFYGRVSDIQAGRSLATITIKSDLDLLNIQMPRALFQAPCSHSLYDGGCTLIKSAFTLSGTVNGSGALPNQFMTSLTAADGYYNSGVIAFTSGINTGISRTIRTYLNSSGVVNLILPLPKTPETGDAFIIYPGCDKSSATCLSKFNNLQNFRGFPYVPNPEVALL